MSESSARFSSRPRSTSTTVARAVGTFHTSTTPLRVATLLATVGGVTDPDVLAAALLHDTVEDIRRDGRCGSRSDRRG